MNIDPKLLSSVAAQIQALDFSEENARIANTESSIVQTRTALDRARARKQEISDLLRPQLGSGPGFTGDDGLAVARALTAGLAVADAVDLSTTTEKLEREREALDAAIPHLAQRIQSLEQAIRETKDGARKRLQPIVQPLVDALGEEAKRAAEVVQSCWASLEALGDASCAAFAPLRTTSKAMAGFIADYGLLARGRGSPVPVPEEVTRTLSSLADKGPAFPIKEVRSSFLP